MEIFLIAAAVVFALVLAGLIAWTVWSKCAKSRVCSAEVLEKCACEYSSLIVGHYGLLNRTGLTVLFRVNGKTMGLFCSQELYDRLEKGQQGRLTYLHTQAISFERLCE